jgi:hypothetical protein
LDVGISQQVDDGFIYITPNPSDGRFILNAQLPNLQAGIVIQIFDFTGRMLYEKHFEKNYAVNEYIDVSSLPKGNYLIKIAGGMIWREKLTIQ